MEKKLNQAKEGKNLKSKGKKAKKIERQVMILFIVLGVIFVSFVLGVWIKKTYFNPNIFNYENFKVYKTRIQGINVDFYVIPIKGSSGKIGQIVMRNDPREIENIPLNVNESLFGGIKRVWIVHSPDITDADVIIAKNEIGSFTAQIGLDTKYAFTKDGEKYGYEEMSCENATSSRRVIDVRLGNFTKVYSEGKCIVVEGANYTDMIKASDKLVIEWLKRLAL